MRISIDSEVELAAGLLQANIPVAKLPHVVTALAALAPVLWNRPAPDSAPALRLVNEDLDQAGSQQAASKE